MSINECKDSGFMPPEYRSSSRTVQEKEKSLGHAARASRLPRYPEDEARHDIARLEEFFALAVSGRILGIRDAERHARWRREAGEALRRVLSEGRAVLAVDKGLDWPYRCLEDTAEALGEAARARPGTARQAGLYLALLPVPGQWARLGAKEPTASGLGEEPEMRRFFLREDESRRRKILDKGERRMKLRHFLQILKPPASERERGVLRVFALPALLAEPRLLDRIRKRYMLFVEPPMGLVFRQSWWRFFTRQDDPAVFGVGGPEDLAWLAGQAGVHAVELAHGDFLPEDAPEAASDHGPEPGVRFDLVFNSSFSEMERKRHHLMLDLLRTPELANATALFLGRDEGSGGAEAVTHAAAEAGLAERVRVVADLRREEVPAWLARCRVGVHLSLYENAARCLYEFLRADLPIVVSEVTAGISPGIVNAMTGLRAPDNGLASAVRSVLAGNYSPRAWFLARLGSRNSTARLNVMLRDLCLGLGRPWTRDISGLASSGASRHADPREYGRLRGEYETLLEMMRGAGGLPLELET